MLSLAEFGVNLSENPMRINQSFEMRLFLFFVTGLAAQALAAEKELKSVGLTVGDLGNPFFVQIAHGAAAQAKAISTCEV